MTIDREQLRWNGWGRVDASFDLGERAERVWAWIRESLGMETLPQRRPCELSQVKLPAVRVPEDVLERLRAATSSEAVRLDARERALHARGRSYPDLLALRAGDLDPAPDVVVYPADEAQVLQVLRIAAQADLAVVPYGGGSSVVGGVTALAGSHRAVITVDTTKLRRVLEVDAVSLTARIQAGAYGPDLEQQLQARGYTLGHYPQSFEFSTLGGWIAARGAGQQSNRYGKAEDWLVSATLATPRGRWRTESFPASAAGPDLNDLVAGGEGIFGIITEATVRIHAKPEESDVRGWLFPDLERGLAAVRDVMQQGLPVAMLRLSDAEESRFFHRFTTLRHPPGAVQRVADDLLGLSGWGEGRVMMLVGVEGERDNVRATLTRTGALLRHHRGFPLGQGAGRSWAKSRFAMPYLRDPLLDHGVAVDTLETSTRWSNVTALHRSVAAAIRGATERERASPRARAMVMCHLSHCYEDGASLYFTFLFPQREADALQQWQAIKAAATDAIVEGGGTITHHHGVGTDHAPWLRREKGDVGVAVLAAIKAGLDPDGILNPGKLLP